MRGSKKDAFQRRNKIIIPEDTIDNICLVYTEDIFGDAAAVPYAQEQDLQKVINECINKQQISIPIHQRSIFLTSILIERIRGSIVNLWRIRVDDLGEVSDFLKNIMRFFRELKNIILSSNLQMNIFVELIPEEIIFQGIYYTKNILGDNEDLGLLEIFIKDLGESSSKFLINNRSGELFEYYAHPRIIEILDKENIDLSSCLVKIYRSVKKVLLREDVSEDSMVLLTVSSRCSTYVSFIIPLT